MEELDMNKVKAGEYDCLIIDEAQFLTKDQVELLVKIVDDYNVPVICYGLRTDFQGNFFEGSHWLLARADAIEEVIAAIERYAQRGGSFIVCSKSDRLEPENENEWASVISNGLLEAIGAKARVGKGIVSDAVNMTNESYRLHFTGKDFYNWDNPLTEYLIENTNLMFSCYNAAPIILNGATSVVNAFDTSFVSSYPLYYNGGKNVSADKARSMRCRHTTRWIPIRTAIRSRSATGWSWKASSAHTAVCSRSSP